MGFLVGPVGTRWETAVWIDFPQFAGGERSGRQTPRFLLMTRPSRLRGSRVPELWCTESLRGGSPALDGQATRLTRDRP